MVRHTGEDFINVEGVAISATLPLQSPSVQRAKFDAPEPYRFAADSDASLCEQVLYISMADIEAIIKPHGILNYRWRESVSFVHC